MTKLKISVSDSLNCKPDTATLRLVISATMNDIESLKKMYSSILDNLNSCLDKYNLSKSDLVLGRLDFNKVTRRVTHEKGSLFGGSDSYVTDEFVGYSLSTFISYSTSIDNRNISKVYVNMLQLKNVSCHLDFSCEDIEKYKDELLEKLMLKARSKADIIAKASGLKVGEVVDVDYSVSRVSVFYNSYAMDEDDCSFDCCEVDNSISDFIDDTSKKGQDISDNITVVFSLV